MGMPATTKKSGDLCFAFPNVCNTQVGPATVPIPYPSIGDLGDATDVAESVKIGGNPVVTAKSYIGNTKGDEPALPTGGVPSGNRGGAVIFKTKSGTVKAEGGGIVRMGDTTGQNCDAGRATANAFGTVLGGVPTVLVGD